MRHSEVAWLRTSLLTSPLSRLLAPTESFRIHVPVGPHSWTPRWLEDKAGGRTFGNLPGRHGPRHWWTSFTFSPSIYNFPSAVFSLKMRRDIKACVFSTHGRGQFTQWRHKLDARARVSSNRERSCPFKQRQPAACPAQLRAQRFPQTANTRPVIKWERYK